MFHCNPSLQRRVQIAGDQRAGLTVREHGLRGAQQFGNERGVRLTLVASAKQHDGGARHARQRHVRGVDVRSLGVVEPEQAVAIDHGLEPMR